ncbi:MAG: universal stress protein [Muribaculaceae bacterium]|nr:universal stress protein [Muribaculaceae bacterium]
MEADRLLTIAIHTYEKATQLKALLEGEGITVVLHNVNLSEPVISSGVRVRIKEADLPLALRIIENREIFIMPDKGGNDAEMPDILVPIDFSPYSTQACRLAFDIASRHGARILMLHAYAVPERINLPLSTSINLDPDDTGDPHINEELFLEAKNKLDEFAAKLKEQIKNGDLPPVKFTTEVMASVPEDAILEISKTRKPMLIVMGTRGADKKERELIGSVTAEVLDSCREPVFTVPEHSFVKSLGDVKDVVIPCNLEQEDILAIDALERLLPDSSLRVRLLYIERRRMSSTQKSSELLLEYCLQHYPLSKFTYEQISASDASNYFQHLSDSDHECSLIVIPNKKKNILSRLFNPSLAHKLLFDADIPLMAIPV